MKNIASAMTSLTIGCLVFGFILVLNGSALAQQNTERLEATESAFKSPDDSEPRMPLRGQAENAKSNDGTVLRLSQRERMGRRRYGQGNARQRGAGQGRGGQHRSPMIEVNQQFPEIIVYSEEGDAVNLPAATEGTYTVLVRGCLTCPVFWKSYHETEAVANDYSSSSDGASKKVNFYFVYGSLAHPENNSYVQPFSLEERLMHVAEAKETMQTTIPWLADNMDNELKSTLGSMPNSECVLAPDGKVIYTNSWSDSAELRKVLEEHVGPLGHPPTKVADLDLPTISRQIPTDAGLPKLEFSEKLVPVKTVPQLGDDPFYAKLRVEVEPSVLESGEGQIYLGFHLDPLYHTHWNNLAEPLRFEMSGTEGVTITPANGQSAKVDQPTDKSPREFVVNVSEATSEARLTLTAYYFACSEKPAFCKAITQEYEIHFERDAFAGGVSGRSFRPAGRTRGRNSRR